MKEILKLDYDEMDVSDPDKMTILPHNWKEDTALMLTVTDRVCKGIEKARKLLPTLPRGSEIKIRLDSWYILGELKGYTPEQGYIVIRQFETDFVLALSDSPETISWSL